MFKNIKFLAVIISISTVVTFAQERPVGKFLKDKVRVGEPVQYAFSLHYPSKQTVLFPDSTFNYFPFEFIEKRYFKTFADSTNNVDSVVYTLAAFEIDSTLKLGLPVFYVEDGDSVKVNAAEDQVNLIQTFIPKSDTVKLLENTNYVAVKNQFNYLYWLIGLVVLLIIAVILLLIFGKPILRNIKLKRLLKQHQKFLQSFEALKNQLNENNFQEVLQENYASWKRYLQQLSQKPFTSYSTKEISTLIKDEKLNASLMAIDRVIYAGKWDSNIPNNLNNLLKYADKYYKQKVAEVKNGSTK